MKIHLSLSTVKRLLEIGITVSTTIIPLLSGYPFPCCVFFFEVLIVFILSDVDIKMKKGIRVHSFTIWLELGRDMNGITNYKLKQISLVNTLQDKLALLFIL